jgi:hypothetical protein
VQVFNNYAAWLTDLEDSAKNQPGKASVYTGTAGTLAINTNLEIKTANLPSGAGLRAAAEKWVVESGHLLANVNGLSDGEFVGIAFKDPNFKVDVLEVTAAISEANVCALELASTLEGDGTVTWAADSTSALSVDADPIVTATTGALTSNNWVTPGTRKITVYEALK